MRMIAIIAMLALLTGFAMPRASSAQDEISYGGDARHVFDLTMPDLAEGERAPAILFVHGGGWRAGDKVSGAGVKAPHFASRGWAFASTNYRLVPTVDVYAQAADIAAAVAALRQQPGIDPDRIVLMGHSAGAHLAALVAADPQYLEQVGVDISAIEGVVLLDGAGYDIERQMAEARPFARRLFESAFGDDPKDWQALSPIMSPAQPNADNWLVLHVASRGASTRQAEALADALGKCETMVEVVGLEGESHRSINQTLGERDAQVTLVVDAFLDGLSR